MNFFSSTPFLETFGECFFTGRTHSISLFRVEGAVYRLLVVEGRPIARWSFIDLLEPLEEVPDGAPVRTLGHLPRVARAVRPLDAWQTAPDEALDVCPLVDWSAFANWQDYESSGNRCNRNPDSRRCRRLLERDAGALKITMDTEGRDALEQAIAWKSARYVATGQPDVFSDPRHGRMYEELRRRGALKVSSLRAGSHLLAVHFCVRDAGRRRIWLQAFDPNWARYSPGRLLHEAVLEHSYRHGELECDMLLGGEPFKFAYATHVRICGPAGKEPLAARFERMARPPLRRVLKDRPRVQACMRRLRHYLSDR